jgi:hypothetical protein
MTHTTTPRRPNRRRQPQRKTALVPQPIHTVALHHRPHLDEGVALSWAKRYGAELLPGIDTCRQFTFQDAGTASERMTADEWERYGRLYLGVGGGRFDEHPTAGTGEKKTSSCAMLMAEFLGITDRPEVRELLAYTHDNDQNGSRDGLFGLGRLTNSLNARYTDEPELALSVLLRVLDALAVPEYIVSEDPISLSEIVALYLIQSYGKQESASLTDLRRMIAGQKSTDASPAHAIAKQLGITGKRNPELAKLLDYLKQEVQTSPYSLVRLVDRLNAAYPAARQENLEDGSDMVTMTVLFLIEAIVHQAYEFTVVAKKELASEKCRVRPFKVVGSRRVLTMASLRTSCEGVKGRAFSKKLEKQHAALIQVNPRGQIQVFVNPEHNLDLSRIAAALRQAEQEARDIRTGYSEEQLRAEGTLPRVPQWFYDSKTGMVANGTLTAPNTPATRLELGKVVGIFFKHIRAARIPSASTPA